MAFLTGYLIEKALAVDNVFVWLMLFSCFSVPDTLQRRVLTYGVIGAIILRYYHDIYWELVSHSTPVAPLSLWRFLDIHWNKNGAR